MNLLNPRLPPETIRTSRVQAVVLDWAGTTVDHGSLAPARTLQKVFASVGIALSESEVRRDMGLPKKDHIHAILALPRIRDAWQSLRKKLPNESDVAQIYEQFIPLQLSCLGEYSALIPGVVETVQLLRQRNLKIGSTTGYTRAMLDILLERTAKAGYAPSCSITPEDVGAGRPQPFMIFECAVRLQVYPTAAIVKVGDTPADIQEGLNAGAWSVGVAATGNSVGLSLEDFQRLTVSERESRLAAAREELQEAGAHYVVGSLGELSGVLDNINARLQAAS